jgi:hypothetical protein
VVLQILLRFLGAAPFQSLILKLDFSLKPTEMLGHEVVSNDIPSFANSVQPERSTIKRNKSSPLRMLLIVRRKVLVGERKNANVVVVESELGGFDEASLTHLIRRKDKLTRSERWLAVAIPILSSRSTNDGKQILSRLTESPIDDGGGGDG